MDNVSIRILIKAIQDRREAMSDFICSTFFNFYQLIKGHYLVIVWQDLVFFSHPQNTLLLAQVCLEKLPESLPFKGRNSMSIRWLIRAT